jgi:hypothetical protein
MRIIIIIILLILALLIKYKKEYFDPDRTIEPSNFIDDDEDLSIKIDKKLIKKMYEMATFINDNNEYEPSIYSDLPVNYKNRNTYIQILYETYVIDFLDRYIVNRFNADKFINVVYKYPSYDDINDKYPNDKIKKNYDRIFNDLLYPSIKYFYKNVNLNLDEEFFKFTTKDISKEDLNEIKNLYSKTDSNNFHVFMKNSFGRYIIGVFKKLNIIHQNNCNITEMEPFTFTFKELTDENINEIIELVDDIINNEINFFSQ